MSSILTFRATRHEQYLQNEELKEPRISYNKFKRLVLAYIIESHDLFLKPFIDIFREVDGDLDGVINEVRFAAENGLTKLRGSSGS